MELRTPAAKQWEGPTTCEICLNEITPQTDPWFVDGATVLGPWALMCSNCYLIHGEGFGTGCGQRYDSTTLLKMEG